MELSQEGKTVTLIMLTLLNPLIRNMDQSAKEQLIRDALRERGIRINDDQIAEYIYAINDVKDEMIKKTAGLLSKMGIDPSNMEGLMKKFGIDTSRFNLK